MAEERRLNRSLDLRRQLRREQTPAESQMWPLLRGRALDGVKFRRQAHVCGFVVDFACISHGLVVEMDGAVHDEPQKAAQDRERDALLRANGWTVLRFRNGDLQRHPEVVVEVVRRTLTALTPAASQRPVSRRARDGTGNSPAGQGIAEDAPDP